MKRRWYETNPSMIKEYSNNNTLSYKEATIAFMAEWTCEKGHIWKAKVGSRMGKGLTGCPYCSGKKPIKGTNDLSTLYPDIAKEWDYEKNDLKPEEYLPSSNKRVGFVCSKGHKWEQIIAVRTRKNASGCPYCSGRKITCGTNDLATLRPDLAREWNYIRNHKGPDEYTKNSGEVVWWKCKNGHQWRCIIANRVRGNGCPFCAGKKPIVGENDLATLKPELIKEWDYEKNKKKPSECTLQSSYYAWWKCNMNHSWQSIVANRVNGSGCPYCAGQAVWKGYNDLATLCNELVLQWDYIRNDKGPDEYTKNSGEVVWWKCKNGHQWRSIIANRVKGNGCPFCAGKKPIVGENDLATLKPELIKEWDYEKNKKKPSECTLQSSYYAWWKCNMNHSWQSRVAHRVNGSGCPYCAGQKAITGENDLVTVNPEWLKEWDYENNVQNPSQYTLFSGKKVWWVCEKGHHFRTVIASRNKKNVGCPFCSGRKVIPGENDLKTLFPEVVFEWDYKKNRNLSPEEVSPQSDKSVWWICKQGHSEHQRIRTRVKGMGCKQCRR